MGSSRNSPVAVIISKNNGYGLTIDAKILAQALEGLGISATIVQPGDRPWSDRFFRRRKHDFIFHLERVYPAWLDAGGADILIPNQERFPKRHIGRLKNIDLVLTKTVHAREIFASLGCNTEHVRFESKDLQDPTIKKDWKKFLHVAGGSTLKGTEDILAIWRKHPEWPELMLVQKQANLEKSLPENVDVAPGFLSESQLHALMNSCGIHLCPSRSEGWGHYIHEALGCGAVVITTDAPPMNEFIDSSNGVVVETTRCEERHLGTNYFVAPSSLEATIQSLLAASPDKLEEIGRQARQSFLDNRNAFHDRLRVAIAGLCPEPLPSPLSDTTGRHGRGDQDQ